MLRRSKTVSGRYRLIAVSALFLICLMCCCIGRVRSSNIYWQMDSLKIYTLEIDSLLKNQNDEIARLRIDFYTKTGELGEKMEMLSSRIGDAESQLTMLNQKLGSKRVAPDSEDISKISPEARLIYESAYINYVKGNYEEAINGFQSYLQIAADSPLADNAYYWIGECYTAMGKSQNAVNTFQELINKYPGSSKRPTALYKIALIYEAVKDLKTANHYYNLIIKDFPNSPEAALARDKVQP